MDAENLIQSLHHVKELLNRLCEDNEFDKEVNSIDDAILCIENMQIDSKKLQKIEQAFENICVENVNNADLLLFAMGVKQILKGDTDEKD